MKNMIRISSLKLEINHNENDILNAAAEKLRSDPADITALKIVKKSLDARDKGSIHWNYIIDVSVKNEAHILKSFKNNRNITMADNTVYKLPRQGTQPPAARPCITGSGPAGLFCTYFLAKEGYRPVLIEQGEPVAQRLKTAEKFWKEGILNPSSNIQFGEGGAGTFSDGKLNTGVSDKSGRIRLVLETFVENGAPEEILYSNRPHIGTDILSKVVENMRNRIIGWRGEVLFNTKFVDFAMRNGKLISIALESRNEVIIKPCTALILAPGNSARDTFAMLESMGVDIEAKAFAAGVRTVHLKEDINRAMYGPGYDSSLPPADYRLTYKAKDGRGVYTFCMCPGGYVVNSSSEEECLCINGMSLSKRDGKYSNSAVVVTVSPEDTGADKDPMLGIEFQRELERKAYKEGAGFIPVQRLGDFKERSADKNASLNMQEAFKGAAGYADINRILPEYICSDIKEAFDEFGKKIKGFDDPDTLLCAVESRTSCPIRIKRDEHFESNIKGIFPAGEGAGYAGGITSSAIDGIKVFEEIYSRYAPEINANF